MSNSKVYTKRTYKYKGYYIHLAYIYIGYKTNSYFFISKSNDKDDEKSYFYDTNSLKRAKEIIDSLEGE